MRAERQLLALGEFLVSRACRRLPPDLREERYREWVAELPAILHDPQVMLAPRRALRMLGYAADTARGAMRLPGGSRGWASRLPLAALNTLSVVIGPAVVMAAVWAIALNPADGLNYVRLGAGLVYSAYRIRRQAGSHGRLNALLGFTGLTGYAVSSLADAAGTLGWARLIYFFGASLLALLLAVGVVAWRVRRLPARGRHAAPPGR